MAERQVVLKIDSSLYAEHVLSELPGVVRDKTALWDGCRPNPFKPTSVVTSGMPFAIARTLARCQCH